MPANLVNFYTNVYTNFYTITDFIVRNGSPPLQDLSSQIFITLLDFYVIEIDAADDDDDTCEFVGSHAAAGRKGEEKEKKRSLDTVQNSTVQYIHSYLTRTRVFKKFNDIFYYLFDFKTSMHIFF
jgi:hypothetical protein